MKRSYLTVLLSIVFLPLFSQVDIPEWKKRRYLSEEEMYLEVRSARDFVETDPPEGMIRNVAEFDPMQGVLVRYPFGVPLTLLKEIAEDVSLVVICEDQSAKNDVISTFENYGINLDNCYFLYAETNSWWIRDYGPWFVFDGDGKPGIVDFPYNRPRPRDNDIPAAVAHYLDIDLYGMNILHTGGNYMTDGLGKSSSTDLISEENPAVSDAEINAKLREYLAIEDYYILPDPLDDYIKHIDCWGKFLTPNKVILGQVSETDYRYDDFEEVADFFSSTISAYGTPFEVYRVYTPGGNDVTPYTNSLIVNDKVFVPLSGSVWDDEAISAYEEALPGYEIIGIYHWGWYNTDALHCRTKGIADLGMLYIEHKPILGKQEYAPDLEFVADISAYSGSAIYPDSIYLNYLRNDLHALYFSLFTKRPDGFWYATISDLRPGDRIQYWIEANDASGRTSMHPSIGHNDPHDFQLKTVYPDITINPDALVFDNHDNLKFGMDATIVNELPTHVVITDIEIPDDNQFNIDLADIPSFPFILEKNEEMQFSVYFKDPLPAMGTYLTDTIDIKTEYFTHPLVFTIDRTGVNTIETTIKSNVKVFPQPADHVVHFELDIEQLETVKLNIFNTSGKTIFSTAYTFSQGNNRFTWNRKDDAGIYVPSGNYFYKIEGAGNLATGNLVLE